MIKVETMGRANDESVRPGGFTCQHWERMAGKGVDLSIRRCIHRILTNTPPLVDRNLLLWNA